MYRASISNDVFALIDIEFVQIPNFCPLNVSPRRTGFQLYIESRESNETESNSELLVQKYEIKIA